MLKWYHWTLFGVVVLVALAMSWYSMMDLAYTEFGIPLVLSGSISLTFDVGGIFLGLMAILYARTTDSGFWAELWTFIFVLTSVYINVQHAYLADYGLVGMVMFGAAPVIAGVMLKILLSYLTRQARREAGRLVEKLPSVGWLTWIFYRRETWKLMSLAMRKRLVEAAHSLELPEDRHAIFVGQLEAQKDTVKVPEILSNETEEPTPELVQDSSITLELNPGRTEADIDEIVYDATLVTTPEWLPREPTMSLGRIAEICVENGQTDTNTILQWAKDIKRSDVKYGSMYKAVQRARQKV